MDEDGPWHKRQVGSLSSRLGSASAPARRSHADECDNEDSVRNAGLHTCSSVALRISFKRNALQFLDTDVAWLGTLPRGKRGSNAGGDAR